MLKSFNKTLTIFILLKRNKYIYLLYQLTTKTKTMIKAFKIYKEGTTDFWITILIPEAELTQELFQFKINKFLSLGYQIQMINK